jgi:hypothetical protein
MRLPEKGELAELVAASGLALQLKVEDAIKQNNDHAFRVVSREHPWSLGNDLGFVDLVLASDVASCVIECTQARDGSWVFIVPKEADGKRTGMRVSWLSGKKYPQVTSGCSNVDLLPFSYDASFCVASGIGARDRTMLERICSTLLRSCDALATQEIKILSAMQQSYGGYYIPMIVTTAELYACKLDPDKVSLADGDLSDSDFEKIPYIRFTKAFSVDSVVTSSAMPASLEELSEQESRTVVVVNASHVVDFLTAVRQPDFAKALPWDTIRP